MATTVPTKSIYKNNFNDKMKILIEKLPSMFLTNTIKKKTNIHDVKNNEK